MSTKELNPEEVTENIDINTTTTEVVSTDDAAIAPDTAEDEKVVEETQNEETDDDALVDLYEYEEDPIGVIQNIKVDGDATEGDTLRIRRKIPMADTIKFTEDGILNAPDITESQAIIAEKVLGVDPGFLDASFDMMISIAGRYTSYDALKAGSWEMLDEDDAELGEGLVEETPTPTEIVEATGEDEGEVVEERKTVYTDHNAYVNLRNLLVEIIDGCIRYENKILENKATLLGAHIDLSAKAYESYKQNVSEEFEVDDVDVSKHNLASLTLIMAIKRDTAAMKDGTKKVTLADFGNITKAIDDATYFTQNSTKISIKDVANISQNEKAIVANVNTVGASVLKMVDQLIDVKGPTTLMPNLGLITNRLEEFRGALMNYSMGVFSKCSSNPADLKRMEVEARGWLEKSRKKGTIHDKFLRMRAGNILRNSYAGTVRNLLFGEALLGKDFQASVGTFLEESYLTKEKDVTNFLIKLPLLGLFGGYAEEILNIVKAGNFDSTTDKDEIAKTKLFIYSIASLTTASGLFPISGDNSEEKYAGVCEKSGIPESMSAFDRAYVRGKVKRALEENRTVYAEILLPKLVKSLEDFNDNAEIPVNEPDTSGEVQ